MHCSSICLSLKSSMMLIWIHIALVTLKSCNADSIFSETLNEIPDPTTSRNESTGDIPAPSSRIINGFFVAGSRFKIPWIVALFQWNQPFCTGSLITNQHILTAAHCVAFKPKDSEGNEICRRPFQHKSQFQAVIGEVNYNNAKYNAKKKHQVIQHWIHDQYKGGCDNWNFDFAILKLQKTVASRHIPVCLHSGAHKNKKKVFAFGYGATGPHKNRKDSYMSNDLKGKELNIVSNKKCSWDWGWDVGNNKICCRDGYETHHNFAGPCSGDSGGPLVVHDHSYGFILVGVTSFVSTDNAYACAGNAPTVFGRVSKALSFIRSKAGSIKTC